MLRITNNNGIHKNPPAVEKKTHDILIFASGDLFISPHAKKAYAVGSYK